jgi:outer membrane protein OmpA-like peptidoglycan-associated protein
MSIRPDDAEALGKVAGLIRSHATAPIEIEGHTDGKGQPAYNQKLSEQRTKSVKAWRGTAGSRPRA